MSDEITVQPYYSTAKDRIVRPAEVLPVTRYFIREWQRYLDRDEYKLIQTLRSLALDQGPLRDGVPEAEVAISLPELATITGISATNLKRKLSQQNLGNSHLGKFIRKEPQYRIVEEIRMARKSANLYYIQMDDPPAPHDERRLQDEMSTLEATVRELQKSGALDHLLGHKAQSGPQHRDQNDPHDRAQAGPIDRDQDEPRPQARETRKGPERPGTGGPHRPGVARHESDDSIEATMNVNASVPGTENKEERVQSRRRSRMLAEMEAVAAECAARLRDLENIGYYRRRARQMWNAGRLQHMLVVLGRVERAVREKEKSDPIERPGAYFNRMLEVEMDRLGIQVEHERDELSPQQIRRAARESLRGTE